MITIQDKTLTGFKCNVIFFFTFPGIPRISEPNCALFMLWTFGHPGYTILKYILKQSLIALCKIQHTHTHKTYSTEMGNIWW